MQCHNGLSGGLWYKRTQVWSQLHPGVFSSLVSKVVGWNQPRYNLCDLAFLDCREKIKLSHAIFLEQSVCVQKDICQ